MNTRRTLYKSKRRTSNILLVCLPLLLSSDISARPDYRNLVFEPYPIPVESIKGVPKSVPEGVSAFEATGATGATKEGLNSRLSSIHRFLSFDKYIPASFQRPGINIDTDIEEATRNKLEDVNRSIDEKGPYDPEVEKNLVELAHLYQDSGEHRLALDTYNHAIQVNKISNGLFHENQIPLIKSSIQSLLALGEYDKVNEQLEFLIYLHQKYYGSDSTEMIKPLASKVAWDMYFYEKYSLQGGGNAFGGDALINGFTPVAYAGDNQVGILTRTQELIIKAIHILVKANDFSNPFLHKFEQQLIETYFYQAYHDGQARASHHIVATPENSYLASDPFDYTKANFHNGKNAYHRLLKYLEQSQQQGSLEYVVATIGLGDWYLLFNKLESSQEQYAYAAELLGKGNFSEQDRQLLLNPSIPTDLPAFGGMPLFSSVPEINNPEKELLGFVDVAFELSRWGKVTKLDTLDQSPGTPRYITTELEWKIRDAQFRPYFGEGEPGESGPLAVRYYYSY